jgi:hypothetical protein
VGTSRAIIVAPGVRTAPVTAGWRADAATIADTIRAHPLLIVTGVVGFSLRGGILVLIVPILVLPTSVEVRLLLGDGLGTTGLTPAFFIAVAALSVISLGVALFALYAIARCELSGFARYSDTRLLPARRTLLTRKLFVIEAFALLTILLAAVPLVAATAQAAYSEIVLPSSTASIYERVVHAVTPQIVGFIAAIVIVEAISAVTARRTMSRAFGLGDRVDFIHHPFRMLAVAVVGWALLVGALLVAIPALRFVWDVVRSVYLQNGLSGGVREVLAAMAVALLFGGVFAVVLFVCGLVSTIRSGLWTLASLR